MPAAAASPTAAINVTAKEITAMQLQAAREIAVEARVSDPVVLAALVTAMALNRQSLKMK